MFITLNLRKSNLSLIVTLSILLIGCPAKNHIQNKLKGNSDKNESIKNHSKLIESTEISISCNKETIEDYLDKGWKVISSTTEEVPCSWKTIKATKRCNLERDKGCKITVPDLMGEKTTYILERESSVNKNQTNSLKSKDLTIDVGDE